MQHIKISHVKRKIIKKIDPLLEKPTENIEKNLAEGIDDMIPDPNDIPGGFLPDLTPRPDLEEADAIAILQQKEGKKK